MITIYIITLLIIALLISCWYSRCYYNNKIKEKFEPEDCIITNTPDGKVDDFITTFQDVIFSNDIINEKINYLITYHHIDYFPYYKNYFNIILDGEPNDISNIKADMIISTKKYPNNINTNNTLYVPYFIYFLKRINTDPELVLIKKINETIPVKSKFCAFAYSNCDEKYEGVKNRKRFYNKFQEITNNRVDNLGRCYNTTIPQNGTYLNNNIIFENYKFVISFENQEIEGYISEKIITPMMCRSIPIYLGAPDISDYFNPKSFINVRDFNSYEDCINYILKVDSDQYLYEKILNEPYFKDNKIDKKIFSFYYGGNFYRNLEKKIPENIARYIKTSNFYSQNIIFNTFSDGIVYKTDRIKNESIECDFFKEMKIYSPIDFDENFKEKHDKFISKNKRGFGYWIWKPYINLKTLDTMSYGDICVYCDSGCVINKKAVERIKYYYNLLENENDMLCFKIKYDELDWIKKDTLKNILKYKNMDYNSFLNKILNEDEKQRCTGVFLFKKTKKVENFFKDWYTLCENYHNIDDSPSIEANFSCFKENRHDQSIFSILSKLYNFHVLDDNFEDSNQNYEKLKNGKDRPFLPYRLKE